LADTLRRDFQKSGDIADRYAVADEPSAHISRARSALSLSNSLACARMCLIWVADSRSSRKSGSSIRTLVTLDVDLPERNPAIERNVFPSHRGRFGEPAGLGEPINLGDVDHPPAAFARDFKPCTRASRPSFFAALDLRLLTRWTPGGRDHSVPLSPRRHTLRTQGGSILV